MKTPSKNNAALPQQAYSALAELIVTVQLEPGSSWSESELCKLIDIGRTPVREALQRLQREHLVEIIPRFGVRIAEINVESQLLLLEVRRELERLLASCAAKRATANEKQQCKEMSTALHSMRDGEVMAFLRYHYEVKKFIAEIARNPYAAQMILPLYAISQRYYYLHYLRSQDIPLAADYHIAIVDAISEGDPDNAAAAADRMMDYATAITRSDVGCTPTVSGTPDKHDSHRKGHT